MAKPPVCKDCYPDPGIRKAVRACGWIRYNGKKVPARPAPYPGPRCKTHWVAEKTRRKDAIHKRSVQTIYGLTEGQYEQLYLFQGSRCAICQRATGATRRLSVDHDHVSGNVRGLLCRPCNTVIGRAGDDPEWFDRGALYLRYPPFRRMTEWQPPPE